MRKKLTEDPEREERKRQNQLEYEKQQQLFRELKETNGPLIADNKG